MPPKPKKTREEVVSAAIELIKRDGVKGLTARSLAKLLEVAPSSVFTHFAAMDEVLDAAMDAIREIYEGYVSRGLSKNPPFKGFGFELIRFLSDFPKLFEAMFLNGKTSAGIDGLLGAEGHESVLVDTISQTFGVCEESARGIYRNVWVYSCGIASLISAGICSFTEQELSTMLGAACRGFLLAEEAPRDDRVNMVPEAGMQIPGSVGSYLLRAK